MTVLCGLSIINEYQPTTNQANQAKKTGRCGANLTPLEVAQAKKWGL